MADEFPKLKETEQLEWRTTLPNSSSIPKGTGRGRFLDDFRKRKIANEKTKIMTSVKPKNESVDEYATNEEDDETNSNLNEETTPHTATKSRQQQRTAKVNNINSGGQILKHLYKKESTHHNHYHNYHNNSNPHRRESTHQKINNKNIHLIEKLESLNIDEAKAETVETKPTSPTECCDFSSTRDIIVNNTANNTWHARSSYFNSNNSNNLHQSIGHKMTKKCPSKYHFDLSKQQLDQHQQSVSSSPISYCFQQPSNAHVEYFSKKSIEWKDLDKTLIDSHCHFDMLFNKISFRGNLMEYFEKYKSIYLENIEAFVNISCQPGNYSSQVVLNKYFERFQHPKVKHTLGCHPHFANLWKDHMAKLLEDAIDSKKIVAIGECGLDRSYKNKVDSQIQVKVFKTQLEIAKRKDFPVVIHCRETEQETLELLSKHLEPEHKIHLHCFTGKWSFAKQFLDKFVNLCIGITPLITQSRSSRDLAELFENLPIDRVLLETDAPYFMPNLNRFPSEKPSHPAYIFSTAECLATCKNLPINQIFEMNRKNVRRIYGF